MLRRTRRISRLVVFPLTACLCWLYGPSDVGRAAHSDLQAEVARRQGKGVALGLHARRAIRGAATWPGPPRHWQYSASVLGGYGQANCLSGNLHLAIGVVGYAGKGVPTGFTLYFNSAATVSGARPPISSGWSHSYNVYLLGAGTSTVTVVEGDGSQNAFVENMDGTFTSPPGVWDTLTRHMDGTYRLTRKHGVKLNFGTNNKLATQVDLNNNTTSVGYGANGHASSITDPGNRVLALGYDASNRLNLLTDPANRQFALSYDANSHLQRITFPAPAMGQPQPYFEFVSDATLGTVTSFRNRRGSTWSVAYDVLGDDAQRVKTVTDPNAKTLDINYFFRVLTLEDGTNYSWQADAEGNLTALTLVADQYHPAQTVSRTWDAQHNNLTRVTARNFTWTYTYDSRENILTVVSPANVTQATLTYNSLNRPLTATDALNHQTVFGWSAAGNLTSVQAGGGTTSYQYSAPGLMTQQTDAANHVTAYGHDTYGNMVSLTDADNKVTQWQFNVLSLMTSRIDALNRTTLYSYDNLSRLALIDYPTGVDPSFQYDAEDAVTQFTDATGTTSRGYDALGRMTSENKDGRIFSYTHSEVGNRLTMTDPDNRQFGYVWDNGTRLQKVTLGGADHALFWYDADSNLIEQTNPNASKLFQSWDSTNRLTLLENKRSDASLLSSFSYSYNNDNLRTGVTEADGSTVAWGYDSLHRLTSEVRTGTNAFTSSWVLDAVGNWSSRTLNGATTDYTYTPGDRILTAGSTSYSWNDTGTLASRTIGGATTTFGWEFEAQLTSISTGQSFAYDAEGRRVSRTAGGVTTTFLFDGPRVVLEKQGATTTASYTHGNTLLTRSGETMHFDGHGSVRTVTNGSQGVLATGNWHAYGVSAGGTGFSATPYQYGGTSGYRNDGDAGLLHIGARWYDPAIGRWISADTHLGEVHRPLGRNRYTYCDGDPVNYSDPTGRQRWTPSQYVGFIQALLNKDWDTVVLLIEVTTGVEIPQELKDAISAIQVPKGIRVNLNTVKDVKRLIDQARRHIRRAGDEGPDSPAFNHHVNEIKAMLGRAYGRMERR